MPLYPDLISVGIVSAASDAVALTETPLFVLMATEGAAGRFNRAQRAACNTGRGLLLFLSGLLKVCPG
jgi:hypothetical protein